MTHATGPQPALDPSNPAAAALAYLRAGWHPIPLCRPRPGEKAGEHAGCWQHGPQCPSPGKRPLLNDWPRARSITKDDISRWPIQHGLFNVGVLLGDGLCVVDVDPRNGGAETHEQLRLAGSLPDAPTLRQITPSGGWHDVYLCAIGTSKSKLGPGIDFLAEGSMIVVAPSVHVRTLATGEPYCWEDDLDGGAPNLPTVRWRVAESFGRSAPTHTLGANGSYVPALAPTETRSAALALFAIPPEDRATWMRAGMALKTAVGEAGYSIFDAWSRTTTRGNYDGPENRKQWDSWKPGDGTEGTLNEGSLFWMAREHRTALDPAPPAPPDLGAQLGGSEFPAWVLDDLPGVLGDLYRYTLAASLRPIPMLSLGATLAVLSVVTGRLYGRSTGLRTGLYVLGLAPTGSGKDGPRRAAKRALVDSGLADLLGGEDIASDAGITTALQRSPACLLLLDELGDSLKRWASFSAKPHERGISSLLLKLYSSGGTTLLGKEYSQHGLAKDQRIARPDIDDPCLVIYGTSTPDLWDGLEERDAARGLLGRLLVLEPTAGRAPRRVPESEPPQAVLDGLRALRWSTTAPVERNSILEIVQGLPGCGMPCRIVPTTPDYDRAVDGAEAELDRLGESLGWKGAWDALARLVEQAERLALIRAACCDPMNPVLRAEDLRWGLALARYSGGVVAERLATSVASTETGRRSNRVLAFVRDAGIEGVTAREVARRFRGIPARERAALLADLVEGGLVSDARRDTGGRPATSYVAVAAVSAVSGFGPGRKGFVPDPESDVSRFSAEG